MAIQTEILAFAELKAEYGEFFDHSAKVRLDKKKVPDRLRPLLPYAEFWGIADDAFRESLVQKAPPAVRSNLIAVIGANEDELDQWLAGPEADSPTPTKEYVAFSALRMAADFA